MRLKSKWLAFTINIRPKFAKSVKFTLVTGLGAGTQSDPSVPGVGTPVVSTVTPTEIIELCSP